MVKLIDVYPDEVAGQPESRRLPAPIAMDIFRGRYRESFSNPKPIEPGKPLTYRFALPPANHVFLPGHRIMVQVQSSWFPLYDRNPQTFVDNIFWAKPGDYRRPRSASTTRPITPAQSTCQSCNLTEPRKSVGGKTRGRYWKTQNNTR